MNESESSVPGRVPARPIEDEEPPDIYIGGINDAEGQPEVVITEVQDANAPEWSLKRAMLTGAIIGAFLGSVFFAGYAGTSAWICSARLDCGHWAPIAIVAASGAAATTLAGAAGGYVLHKVYRLLKVA